MNPWDACQSETIAVDRIFYDADFNCRGEFTLQSVKDLADSITKVGRLIYPVLVQPWATKGYEYRLIVGYRRYKAITTFLKWPLIPAIVCRGLTAHQATLLNLTENLERKDLNIWEEARALKRLYPRGVTLARAKEELNKTTNWVSIRLRLLQMPPEIQQKAAAGLLSQANLAIIQQLYGKDQLIATRQIVEARQRGTGKRLPGLDRKLKHRSKYPRGKEEINKMVEHMLLLNIGGLAPRVGAWCAGHITDEVLLEEIAAAVSKSSPDGRTL